MAIDAVRVRAGGSDFFLLADGDEQDVDGFVADLDRVRSDGGTLRVRPRTAPSGADWVGSQPVGGESLDELSGDEDPGTSWRDILGADLVEIETVSLHDPVALWHWAIETSDGRRLG